MKESFQGEAEQWGAFEQKDEENIVDPDFKERERKSDVLMHPNYIMWGFQLTWL